MTDFGLVQRANKNKVTLSTSVGLIRAELPKEMPELNIQADIEEQLLQADTPLKNHRPLTSHPGKVPVLCFHPVSQHSLKSLPGLQFNC